ncbi:zinc finger protein 91 [Trichomycterus rosablanca]|uniref:zinc finger protein 91 n=1 Tax=Trichomycterus rosablanca TaxID=2290929 RepID=UPI002F357CC4
MLGLQETQSTRTPTTKTYRCVTCLARFHTLVSLMEHEESHVTDISSLPKVTSPTCSDCGSLFASTELLDKHCCMAVPTSVPQDTVKCENEETLLACSPTEEFQKDQQTETSAESMKEPKTEPVSEPVGIPSCENSPPCMENVPEQGLHKIHTQKESISTLDADPVNSLILHEHQNELQPTSLLCPSTPTKLQDQSFDNDSDVNFKNDHISLSDSDISPDQSHKSTNANNTLLKMLASAYMSCKRPAQTNLGQNKRALPPRKVSPRAPIQAPMAVTTLNRELSVNQLTQEASGHNTSHPDGMLTVKPSNTFSKKSLISMTKILCPVVALETHQKLIRDNIEGRHQCGLCRRIFQDKDSLIMHHALHRKERVKFCRRCQEFVLSVPSVPFNHDCFSSRGGTLKSFFTSLHSKKLFQCLQCNRTYTRRHRLKVHKCQAAGDPALKNYKVYTLNGASNAREPFLSKRQSTCHAYVGANTEKRKKINDFKVQSGLPKSFPPFLPNMSKTTSMQSMENVVMVEEETEEKTERSKLSKEGQWTVPLGYSEDVLTDEESCKSLDVCKEKPEDEVIIVEPGVKSETKSLTLNKDIRVHISDLGVRRFSCNRCQRSYARRFTLIQHLKICRTGRFTEPNKSTDVLEKMFPCPQCGSSFTRKDNMKMHLKRCQSVRQPYSMDRNKMKQNQAGHDNIFVLPPDSKNQSRQDGSNNGGPGGGNWGIMSLPAVLPRKVTCECGAAFTCPRLLFEHLQKHAQESYICSQCGDNLHSWADLEAHRKLHVQPSRQNIQDKGSPQQQSHVQPQIQQVPCFQSAEQNLKREPQSLWRSRLNHWPFAGPYVCHRCTKVFRLRKSLLRHLSRSCKGDTAVQNKHSCTRCSMAFQNPLALDAHIRLNNCRPAFKPLRCPVCVRWFSSLEGLKRHLMTHSQQEDPICQICDYKCSSHLVLEEHKKSVHGINRVSEFSTVQSATISQSSSSNAFCCQICQRTYPKLQSLKDHLRKVHRPKTFISVNVGNSESKPDIQLLQSQSRAVLPLSTETVQQSQSRAVLPLSTETVQQSQSRAVLPLSTETVQQSQSKAVRQLSTETVHQSQSKAVRQSSTETVQQSQSKAVRQLSTETVHQSQSKAVRQLSTETVQQCQSKAVRQFSTETVQRSQSKHLKCQICSCTFADIQSLINHKRTVHHILGGGLPPLKGTLQPSHASPFQCQVCSRSYPDISSLRNHRRRVHRIIGGLGFSAEIYKGLTHQIQERPFKCQICLRSYPHLASLKKHRRRVHRISGNALDPAKVDATHVKQSPTEFLPLTAPSEPVETVADI